MTIAPCPRMYWQGFRGLVPRPFNRPRDFVFRSLCNCIRLCDTSAVSLRYCGARALLAGVIAILPSLTAFAEVRYGPAPVPTCTGALGKIARCPGPSGYVAVIARRGSVLQINYGHPAFMRATRDPLSSDLLWRGQGALLSTRIEWHLRRDKPFAAIVRIFTLTDDDRPLQQFLIAKVTRSGSCEIGRIDASDRYAIELARIIADSRSAIIECN